jgi:CO dehydrogenase/acetyl-CoA synthase gamma subunit (corrinoid Fe-S protein)
MSCVVQHADNHVEKMDRSMRCGSRKHYIRAFAFLNRDALKSALENNKSLQPQYYPLERGNTSPFLDLADVIPLQFSESGGCE